jgi:hypothetical protein
MRKFTVKAYHAVIKDCQSGVEYAVDIGVVERGIPLDAYWDSWIDSRIYFNMGQDELDALELGDEIAEGDILMEIDRNPSIWEAEYDPKEYNQQTEEIQNA